MKTMKNKIMLSVIIFVVLMAAQVYAVDVPFDIQAKLMLKIISMDRNVARFGDPIKIGVSSDDMLSALKAAGLTIGGKSYSAEKLASPDDAAKYKVVYVGKGMAANYNAIAAKAAGNACFLKVTLVVGGLN
jgi:hypothetical protein